MPTQYTLKSGQTVSLVEKVAVVDYETEWDETYSVSDMSYWHYAHDPRFRAYLVSIVADDFEWAGDPKDAPWESIRNHVWVSHNRPFDSNSVHLRLQELGIVPAWSPAYWGNSLALCAYIRAPRALAKAVKALYGIKLDKTIRDKELKGKKWDECSPDLQARAKEYALGDGRWSRKIWLDHIAMWPLKELRISDLIADRGLRGITIDQPGLVADMQVLKRIVFEAEQKIPWRETGVILSAQHLGVECRKNGIEPPPSLDMKDEDCSAWEDLHGDRFPWVAAMRDYRRANSMLQKYEVIQSRIKPDGRAEFSISYMGTHTGRTAAGEKGYDTERRTFNMLNLPRAPFYIRADLSIVHRKKEIKVIEAHFKVHGKYPDYIAHAIDLRAKLIAAPGKKFAIVDMSQIEARITNWFARDTVTLDLIRSGKSVYEAHAITLMGYVPKEGGKGLKKDDPGKYALAKARELALGYQAGHEMFITMSVLYVTDEEFEEIFDRPVTEEETNWYLDTLRKGRQTKCLAEFPKLTPQKQRQRVNSQIQVQDFRSKKPGLAHREKGLWAKLGNELKRSVGGEHQVELPSGRILQYFDVVSEGRDGIKARTERGGPQKNFYGGKILANSVSATARDLFVDGQIALDDAGIDVVLDVYDEVVTEVPEDFDGKIVGKIMTTNPPWCKTLPLGFDLQESKKYCK